MLDKLAIGTANFGMPYGVLSDGNALSPEVVDAILNKGLKEGINTVDTAFGYGTSVEVLEKYFSEKTKINISVINKFSLKDDFNVVLSRLKQFIEHTQIESFDTLLIHDPQNISLVQPDLLRKFMEELLSKNITKKIGVSIYHLDELKQFQNIFPSSVVQCPINPFNQAFLTPEARDYFLHHNIEVHARSLFLQGVLLSETLPVSLKKLNPYFHKFKALVKEAGLSALIFLLAWANQCTIIRKWIFGLSSLNDFKEIIEGATCVPNYLPFDFSSFINVQAPLIDPRNWNR